MCSENLQICTIHLLWRPTEWGVVWDNPGQTTQNFPIGRIQALSLRTLHVYRTKTAVRHILVKFFYFIFSFCLVG